MARQPSARLLLVSFGLAFLAAGLLLLALTSNPSADPSLSRRHRSGAESRNDGTRESRRSVSTSQLVEPPSILRGRLCGDWSNGEREARFKELGLETDDMSWRCAHYTREDVLDSHMMYGRNSVTKDECRSWCMGKYDATEPTEGKWCCQWTPTRQGSECAWKDGEAVFDAAPCVQHLGQHDGQCLKSDAFESCPMAENFKPMAAGEACKLQERDTIQRLTAATAAACSHACAGNPECEFFAFLEGGPAGSQPECELLHGCHGMREPVPGWVFYYRLARRQSRHRSVDPAAQAVLRMILEGEDAESDQALLKSMFGNTVAGS